MMASAAWRMAATRALVTTAFLVFFTSRETGSATAGTGESPGWVGAGTAISSERSAIGVDSISSVFMVMCILDSRAPGDVVPPTLIRESEHAPGDGSPDTFLIVGFRQHPGTYPVGVTRISHIPNLFARSRNAIVARSLLAFPESRVSLRVVTRLIFCRAVFDRTF